MSHSITEAPLVGVILAAGKGLRAAPLTHYVQKALLPIANTTLIESQIALIRQLGMRRVIVVVGYAKEQIIAQLQSKRHDDIIIEFVEQSEQHGIAHAILQLEPVVQGRMVVFLADIFFMSQRLPLMLASAAAVPDAQFGAALAAVYERDADRLSRNFLIETGPGARAGQALRVIEKPSGYREGLKGCGIYIFNNAIYDAIRRTPRSARRNEFELTDAIQTLIDDGRVVTAHDVIDADINVTYAADVLVCNHAILAAEGLRYLVAPDARVAPDAELAGSVVGAGASVGAGARLEDVVVFPGAQVPAGAHLRRCVVTLEGVFQVDG